MLACQGKPFRAEATISLAAAVSRHTASVAASVPSLTRMLSVWPTPAVTSWPKRMGRACEGMKSPARSTMTGYRHSPIRIGPPV